MIFITFKYKNKYKNINGSSFEILNVIVIAQFYVLHNSLIITVKIILHVVNMCVQCFLLFLLQKQYG